MIREICFPEVLSGRELDIFLSKGWFRMGQSIFTTDYARINGAFLPVFWLRIDLQQFHFGPKQKKLLAANKAYEICSKPFELNNEADELYAAYVSSVDFDAPRSIEEFLYFGAGYNIYDSQAIEVRFNKRLIALGIFDEGEDSIAGIMNFYHPGYRSKSPGKFLMLSKMEYAVSKEKNWYYPGYIAGGTTKFDYKLFPDRNACSIYDRTNDDWIPYVTTGEAFITKNYESLMNGDENFLLTHSIITATNDLE